MPSIFLSSLFRWLFYGVNCILFYRHNRIKKSFYPTILANYYYTDIDLQELTVAVHSVVGPGPIDSYLKSLRKMQLDEYHAAFDGAMYTYTCVFTCTLLRSNSSNSFPLS